MLKIHLKYLRYIVNHKIQVFKECRKLDVPLWASVIHDWQKFTKVEWQPYVISFYGPWKYKERPEWLVNAFDKAWLHHINYGPHHWKYWLLDGKPLEMPDRYRREMLADLMATGYNKHGYYDIVEYYSKNKNKIKLHPNTRKWLELEIDKFVKYAK